MFGHSWRIGRIRGIDIRIDTSWALIALLITYSFYLQFTASYRTLAVAPGIILAAASAVVFFGSVLTHEMAHALESQRRGIPVRDITLFLFGGVTRADVESRGPRDEFLITIVGPATSFLLGAAFVGLSALGGAILPRPFSGALGYLGVVNLFLGAFNLIPGMPLDGGRVLRSALWRGTGNLDRSTRIASQAGEVIGYLIMGIGLFLLFGGALAGGIWLAAIGWFLAGAARSSYVQVQLHHLMEGVDAEDVMARHLVSLPAEVNLGEAVHEYFLRYDQTAFPVEDGGRTVGVLTLDAVRGTPREDWGIRTVREQMQPLPTEMAVAPDSPIEGVLQRLQGDQSSPIFVVSDGRIVGEITSSEVGRYLNRRRAVAA